METLQIRSQFACFEKFSQTAQGWGLDFSQLDCGRFIAELHQIGTPDFLITDVRFNRHLIQHGNPPEGMSTFALMAEDSTPFIWRKQQVTQRSLIVFPKGTGFDATTLAGFHVYTLSLSEHIVSERLQWEDQPPLGDLLQRGGVLEVVPEKIHALRQFLKRLFLEVGGHPDLLELQSSQNDYCCMLFQHLFNVLICRVEKPEKLPFRKHAQLIRNIEPWLSKKRQEQHSVQDLCEKFQVNERTLRRVFLGWYGVSPQQYLLAIRLNGVRKELCRLVKPAIMISDVANSWGFWHMGKFAMTYRRQFGELPSNTIKRMKSRQAVVAELK